MVNSTKLNFLKHTEFNYIFSPILLPCVYVFVCIPIPTSSRIWFLSPCVNACLCVILIFSQLKRCSQASKQSTANMFKWIKCNEHRRKKNSEKSSTNTSILLFLLKKGQNLTIHIKIKTILTKKFCLEKHADHMPWWYELLHDRAQWRKYVN